MNKIIEDTTQFLDDALDRMYRFKIPSIGARNKVAHNYLMRKAGLNVAPVRHNLEMFMIRGRL